MIRAFGVASKKSLPVPILWHFILFSFISFRILGFTFEYPNVSALFVKKTIMSSLNYLCNFFWRSVFHVCGSVFLNSILHQWHMSLFQTHTLKYCSFIVSLEIRYCWPFSFAFLFQSCIRHPRFFVSLFEFWNQLANFSKTSVGITDQFEKNGHLNNSESVNPHT